MADPLKPKAPPAPAIDFDATLSHYDGWKGADVLGAPVPEMVAKVKRMLAAGQTPYIFTARVNPGADWQRALEATKGYLAIAEWCKKHIGVLLPITYVKSPDMTEFFDDRAKEVMPNTGVTLRELIEARAKQR